MPESASKAFFEGLHEGATAIDKIVESHIDVDKKAIDLQKADISLQQIKEINRKMAALGPPKGDTPAEQAANYAFDAAMISGGAGDIATATKAIRVGTDTIQSTAYSRSIQLQDQKQTIAQVAQLAGPVHDQASWEDFVKTVEQQHPPKGAFGSVGLLRDPSGNIYPYSPERVNALKLGLTSADKQVSMRLNEERIKTEEAKRRGLEATRSLTYAREKEIKDKRTALNKVGGGALAPKPADVKYVMELAGKDVVMDDPRDKAAVAAMATEIAENLPKYMQDGHHTRLQALRAAYEDARDKEHKFAGLTRTREIKGSWDKPLTMPMTEAGLPDTTKLKPGSFIQGTGKLKGAVLY